MQSTPDEKRDTIEENTRRRETTTRRKPEKERLTLGGLKPDQLRVLAFPGAVKCPHSGIVERIEMQSVHGADRLSATVHFLIKHTMKQLKVDLRALSVQTWNAST